jgi:hypothetical protein
VAAFWPPLRNSRAQSTGEISSRAYRCQLGLAAQLAGVVLKEVGHGEPDHGVDLDLGEVREVTFDARVMSLDWSFAGRYRRRGRT